MLALDWVILMHTPLIMAETLALALQTGAMYYTWQSIKANRPSLAVSSDKKTLAVGSHDQHRLAVALRLLVVQ